MPSSLRASAATTNEYDPVVAFVGTTRRYLVVWNDGRNAGTSGSDIYGQRVKAGGALAGGNLRVSGSGATGDEMFPALASYGGCGRFMAVWIDGRAGIPVWKVYGSIVSG